MTARLGLWKGAKEEERKRDLTCMHTLPPMDSIFTCPFLHRTSVCPCVATPLGNTKSIAHGNRCVPTFYVNARAIGTPMVNVIRRFVYY